MVGSRLHGVDEHRARPAAVSRAPPADAARGLGFYDLRVPETRQAQSELAQRYGVEAFAYWHYWFGAGDRILDRPFREVLESGQPDMKFCLAWANQTWTGAWHAAPDKVLKQQTYPGPDDDALHFASIVSAFRDDRYLRVNGRPVFYVFRPEELPDAAAFVDRWQGMARQAGLDGLYLVAEASDLLGRGSRYRKAEADGFDASVYMRLPVEVNRASTLRMRAARKTLARPRDLAILRQHRRQLPARPRMSSRVSIRTGTTPRARVDGDSQ